MYKIKRIKRISSKEYPSYHKRVLKAIDKLNGYINISYKKANDKIREQDGYIYLEKNLS